MACTDKAVQGSAHTVSACGTAHQSAADLCVYGCTGSHTTAKHFRRCLVAPSPSLLALLLRYCSSATSLALPTQLLCCMCLCALLKHVSFCAYCFVAPSFTSQMVYVLQQHMCSACFPCWVPDNKSQFVPMCSACPTCCISRHCRCRQAMCSYTAVVCVFSSGALFTCLHVTDDCMQKKPRTEQ